MAERETYYKPIQKHGIKRLVSRLEDDQMWTSFHNMYERFIDPLALPPKRGWAHDDAFRYWAAFRDMMKWKMADIRIQRLKEQSDGQLAALETSFGESSTNDVLKEEYGILVKRQDGSQINPVEIEQLKTAWVNVNKAFGDLSLQAKESNLKLSHTGLKYVFASKAAGMYVPDMGTIAVSAKFGGEQFESTLAHETAHWIDNKIGKSNGRRYASDDFESTAGLVARALRDNMNVKTDSKYVNATIECFARALEQYYAIETFGDEATLMFCLSPFDKERKYFTEDNYVSKSVYEEKLKPLIKKFFEEHNMFFKYDVEIKKRGGLVASNGNKSNLTPEQYKLVREDSFKEFFGDWEKSPRTSSKAVDENGEPKIFYHGTMSDEFFIFKTPSYFTDKKERTDIYKNQLQPDGIERDSKIYEVFLNIRKPKHLPMFSTRGDILKALLNEKTDGVIAPMGNTGANEYIVKNPSQIKLADGSNTNFDSSNPDIRFDTGGLLSLTNNGGIFHNSILKTIFGA